MVLVFFFDKHVMVLVDLEPLNFISQLTMTRFGGAMDKKIGN